ncbi:MAG: endonuclease I family protein [Bacteriovoracaceae bacterium]
MLSLALLFLGLFTQAYADESPVVASYWGKDFLNSTFTKESIQKIITDNKPKTISYPQARVALFNQIYLEKDARGYFIQDVYCERNIYSSDVAGIGPNSVPNSNLMNIEHTWPQSRFSKQYVTDTQKTDLHHLYPSNSHTNSQRGNYMFAEVSSNDVVDDCKASNLGSALITNDGKDYFEPSPKHRGNVARALFYFSVRYAMVITPTEELYLRKWHKEDPIDSLEVARHEQIYKILNTRNPFIDYPQLVDKIENF